MPFALGCRGDKPSVTQAALGGWEALAVRNGVAEVLVVPAVGRIMDFRLLDTQDGRGPFWRHPSFGRRLGADENGWINHGGDKAWPAPQSDWSSWTGKGWPPPRAFDALPYAATVEAGGIVLLSPIDVGYGIRVRRRITLDPLLPEMTVETTYEKVAGGLASVGDGVGVGVWTITQLVSPERMFIRLPRPSTFPSGYARRLPVPPAGLKIEGGLLSLERDPVAKTMIGSDGDMLVWVGTNAVLLIENETAATAARGAWPDGLHSQIYTSPDASQPYVELELLERMRPLAPGDTATLRARYTLARRTTSDPDQEARRIAVERARGQ